MKDKMAKPIGLTSRGSIKQVRVCIPKDLWDAYDGRKDFRISLGPLTGADAKAEAHRIRATKDAEFDAKRRELSRVVVKVTNVPQELVEAIAKGVYTLGLTQDDEARETPQARAALADLSYLTSTMGSIRIGRPSGLQVDPGRAPMEGLTADMADALAGLNSVAEADAAIALARRDLKAVQPYADKVARRLGLVVDWTSDSARDALRMSLEAHRKAWRDRASRDHGDVIPTPKASPIGPGSIQGAGKTHKLSEVFDKWKASGDNPSPATVRKKRVAVRLYEQFTQDAPIESLTVEQGGEFAGWLLVKCAAEKTAKDHLEGVKSLLTKATKAGGLGWLSENPWQGHRVKVRQASTRKPWRTEDLVKLFDSDIFNAYDLPSIPSAGGSAAYWVPLLGIFTGARQSELCQLRVVDMEPHEGGFHLYITSERADEAAGLEETQTKAAVSRRRIPVHPELLRLGFAEYWADTKSAGHTALFPDVQRVEGRGAGEYFSDWFLIYRRERGVDVRWQDFHAFRHTASTRLTDAGVPDSVSDYLTGHSSTGRGSARNYKHMQDLREQQAKLQYPELKLQRVYLLAA
jgi:integrase